MNFTTERISPMFQIGNILTTPPNEFKTPLQKETYKALDALKIPFKRVDTDEAITMEDCILSSNVTTDKIVVKKSDIFKIIAL